MVEFDAGFLTVLLHPNPRIPPNPMTSEPIKYAKERIEHLIDTLSERGEQVIIPTPALAEVLIALGRSAASTAIDNLHGEAAFKIEGFDERAAVELSLMSELSSKEAKRKDQTGTWAKVKFDRQIVAIAKVNGVKTIYSTDKEVLSLAKKEGLQALSLDELPLPPPKTPNMFEGEKNA